MSSTQLMLMDYKIIENTHTYIYIQYIPTYSINTGREAVVAMIVWLLDLQLSPLMLRVRISIRARCTTLCNKISQRLATGRWFSPDTPVSSTNKTDCHDITKILLKVALNTIKKTNKQSIWHVLLYGTCVILTDEVSGK